MCLLQNSATMFMERKSFGGKINLLSAELCFFFQTDCIEMSTLLIQPSDQ